MATGTDLGNAYIQIIPSADGIGKSISGLLDKEAGSAGKSAGSKLSGALGGALKTGLTAATAAVGAATAAVGAFATAAVSGYASYEQLVGGVDKLYGDASEKLQKFADQAYMTSGMSANAYMETATSFSAALINSLGGDVDAAADMTDVAMKAISDNVNVFGSDMTSVTNAFQGFAKQNYTMLDNLKLGYGGTKEEMERLIEDANEWGAANGKASDLSIDSFADVVQAIQQMQEKQNIAGTTAAEAMRTIEGSANATKAAWSNVITAIGRGEGLDEALSGLTTSLFGENEGEGLLSQVIPRIQTTMESIGTFISTAGPMITERLPDLINSIVPSLLSSAQTMISSLGQGLLAAIPEIMPTITQLITDLADMLIGALPAVIQAGTEIILSLVTGISQALPQLIPKLVEVVSQIVTSLADNIPMLIDAGLQVMNGLVEGIIEGIPTLIAALPTVIQSAINALIAGIPMLIEGTIQLVNGLVAALPEILTALIEALPTIITSIVDGLVVLLPMLIEGSIQLVAGVIAALPQILAALVEAGPQILQALIDGIVYAAPLLWQMITDLGSQALTFLGELGTNMLTWASEAFTNLINTITGFVSGLPTTLAYYAGYAIGSFITFFRELPQNLQLIWEDIILRVIAFGDVFKTRAIEIAKNFLNSIIDGLQSLPSKVASLGNQIAGAITNLPDRFLEIGSNIVQGLWNGISSGWSWLTSKVSELASSLLQGAKDALGIASPSKVFRDQVGKWIPAGIAVGITENMSPLNKAMTKMSNEMLNTGISDISNMGYSNYGYNAATMATGSGYHQTVNIYSPRELTPSEVARQTRNATRNMVLALRGV